MIKVGTCGFPMSREKYWKVFKVVEVQKTFYTDMSEKLAKNGVRPHRKHLNSHSKHLKQ